jgi:hypothetical protein
MATFISNLGEITTIAPVGLTATINTAKADFQTPPCYSARIAGPRALAARQALAIIDGLVQITDPRPAQFTVYVLLLAQIINSGDNISDALTTFFSTIAPAPSGGGTSVVGITAGQQEPATLTTLADWRIVWMGEEG